MALNFKEFREWLAEANPEALLADGFEEALMGYVETFSAAPIALYNRAKCIEILMKRDGMTDEEAEEFFCFKVSGAYVGESTPGFAGLLGNM